MKRSGLLFGALAAALVAIASTTPLKVNEVIPIERSEIVYRLPTTIRPNHYDIELVPNFTDEISNFTGKVAINFTVVTLTNVIIVHSDDLNITQSATTVFSVSNNTNLSIATQSYDPLRHFYIITFRNNLPLGEYNITLIYNGQFSTDMYGFYRSSYQVGNETRWLVSTQFQPTAARRAFPCFDEPGLKATFKINIAHFPNQVALSNTPNISTSTPDASIGGRVWTEFQTTLKMSTYLLVFIVSDFERVSSANQFFSIWSRPEAIGTTAWALQATQELHAIFLNVLLTENPWPKADHIAIPDFAAGAMENWGLNTYREGLLLWQDGQSSLTDRENIGSIISHELAHVWFGNLVSPTWWNHLWFSEGFASFFQYIIPSLTYPQWRFAERMVTDQRLTAMVSDSLETTRAMTNVVGSRDSILASFDNIAYFKGSSVFRMLYRVMREDLFSHAIGSFLTEAAFGTFEPDSLWSHMQTVADANTAVQNHVPIKRVMDSWVNQPGYPVVTVVRNYSTMVAAFSQERFFLNPDSPTANPESQRWWIPITFTTGNAPAFCNGGWLQPDWIRVQDKAITVSNVANNTWLLANCQAIGFYRTNYDTRNWELLTDYLNGPDFTQINAINRGVLVDDALNLARAGYIDYSVALNLTTYLVQETDFIAWRAAIHGLSYLNRILAGDAYFPFWQSYLRNLLTNVYTSLGWFAPTSDSHPVRLHRAQILNLACQLDMEHARSSAEALFGLWLASPQLNRVDPDLRPVIYCWGIRNASEATWDTVWSRFQANDLATEENVLLRALACSQNATILEKYLKISISPNSGIRSQDTLTVFMSVLNEPANLDTIINFIGNNTAAIAEFYGGFNTVETMLFGIADRITNNDQLEKFRTFVHSEELGASSVVKERALLTASRNLDLILNKVPVIQDWLQDQGFVSSNITMLATEPIPETTVPTTEALVKTTTVLVTSAVVETTPEDKTAAASFNGGVAFTASSFFIITTAVIAMTNHLIA